MSGRPLISMVLIARDEKANVKPCFDSWWSAVDEVVLVDTGSRDGTVKAAQDFARQRKQSRKLTVRHFDWTDDFAAARNFAQSLATGEWITWADLDDTIENAEFLRHLAENAPAETAAFFCDYRYAEDEHGNCLCTLKRERLVRNGISTWVGRVHEAQLFEGKVELVPADRIVWRHRKKPGDASERNLKILEQWAQDEPANPRVMQYLGTERAGNGKHEQAVEAYRRYLQLPDQPEDHRAQTVRKLSASLLALEQVDEAFEEGLRALGEFPSWPDTYLTLAQCAAVQGRHQAAIEWAGEVIRRGQPNTLLIINPLDYTVQPRAVIAAALAGLNRIDEACKVAEEALAQMPDHPGLRPAYEQWRVTRKRDATAGTWLSCARMLVEHDEQAKALDLLENTVPYYATDHPGVVQLRSEIRERLHFATNLLAYSEHYETGGSRVEDMIPDEKVTELCEALPRVQFLARTVRQLQEAA